MRKYLTAALAVVMAASLSMTAFAAESPGNGSSSNNTPSTSTGSSTNTSSSSSSSSSSKSSSSKKSSSHKSGGGSSSSAAASTNKSSNSSSTNSAASAQAAANAAVAAVYRPAQAVVTADGRGVAATVSVTAVPAETTAAFAAVAPVFGVTVTDTFAFGVTGIDPSQAVLTALAPGSVPAGSALLVVDAFGNLTIVIPVVLPDGTVTATLPALCQVAVVAVPAVPAA